MLGRLVLIALQLVVGWFAAPQIAKYIPLGGDLRIFVLAAVFAVLVWIVGLVGAQVLREVATPSGTTLLWALVAALIGAGLTMVPQIWAAIPLKFDRQMVPLLFAVLGYAMKR